MAEVDPGEPPELAEVRRDRAAQPVPVHAEGGHGCQPTHFRRYLATEDVVSEGQVGEVGQSADFGRDRAAEGIVVEAQMPQFSQMGDLWRYRSHQVVGIEFKTDHPAAAVGGDAVPAPQGRVGQPVGPVFPFGPSGGPIQALQRGPVGRRDGNGSSHDKPGGSGCSGGCGRHVHLPRPHPGHHAG